MKRREKQKRSNLGRFVLAYFLNLGLSVAVIVVGFLLAMLVVARVGEFLQEKLEMPFPTANVSVEIQDTTNSYVLIEADQDCVVDLEAEIDVGKINNTKDILNDVSLIGNTPKKIYLKDFGTYSKSSKIVKVEIRGVGIYGGKLLRREIFIDIFPVLKAIKNYIPILCVLVALVITILNWEGEEGFDDSDEEYYDEDDYTEIPEIEDHAKKEQKKAINTQKKADKIRKQEERAKEKEQKKELKRQETKKKQDELKEQKERKKEEKLNPANSNMKHCQEQFSSEKDNNKNHSKKICKYDYFSGDLKDWAYPDEKNIPLG